MTKVLKWRGNFEQRHRESRSHMKIHRQKEENHVMTEVENGVVHL